MDSSNLLLIFLVFIATTITIGITSEKLVLDDDEVDHSLISYVPHRNKVSVGETGRFLVQETRSVRTCDKYPRVCAAKGSPGPDCSKRKCVDVMKDRFNCRKCGKKCKYSEICCQGRCVNPSIDERHCGKCKNRCKRGSSCRYGMCSYAN